MREAVEDKNLASRGLLRFLSPAAQETLWGDDLTSDEVGDAMGVLTRFGFPIWIDPTDKARAFPTPVNRKEALRRVHDYHDFLHSEHGEGCTALVAGMVCARRSGE